MRRRASSIPNNYLAMRLSPDMFPFVRQVQSFCDHAKNSSFRLAGQGAAGQGGQRGDLRRNPRAHPGDAGHAEIDRRQGDGRRRDARDRHSRRPEQAEDARRRLSPAFRHAEFLFPPDHRLRHPARERRRDRQARFHRARSRTSSSRRAGASTMAITRLHAGPRMSQAVVHGSTDLSRRPGRRSGERQERRPSRPRRSWPRSTPARRGRIGQDARSCRPPSISPTSRTFAEMNAVWDAWVPAGHAPARATVEAKLAAPAYTVEIACIAARAEPLAQRPVSAGRRHPWRRRFGA